MAICVCLPYSFQRPAWPACPDENNRIGIGAREPRSAAWHEEQAAAKAACSRSVITSHSTTGFGIRRKKKERQNKNKVRRARATRRPLCVGERAALETALMERLLRTEQLLPAVANLLSPFPSCSSKSFFLRTLGADSHCFFFSYAIPLHPQRLLFLLSFIFPSASNPHLLSVVP